LFRGVNSVNLDSKGRIGIPKRYRAILEDIDSDNLVVTIDTEEKCLLIYPQEHWDAIQEKIEKLSSFNPTSRRIQRLLIGHATDLELDGNGRILIPPMLREYAGLKKKGVLLGQGKKIELWDEECWSACRDNYLSAKDDDESIPEELESLSL